MKGLTISVVFLGLIRVASACSGPRAQEIIAKNLAFGRICLVLLVAVTLKAFSVAIPVHRYALPVFQSILAIFVWIQLGTAYGGDCGMTAAGSGVLGAIIGAGALAWLVVSNRRQLRRPDVG